MNRMNMKLSQGLRSAVGLVLATLGLSGVGHSAEGLFVQPLQASARPTVPFSVQIRDQNQNLLPFYASISFQTEPRRGTGNTMSIRLLESRTGALYPKSPNLKVGLSMPTMGHGSRPPVVEKERDANGNEVPGSYVAVKNPFFTMSGQWEIVLRFEDSSGQIIGVGIFHLELVDAFVSESVNQARPKWSDNYYPLRPQPRF